MIRLKQKIIVIATTIFAIILIQNSIYATGGQAKDTNSLYDKTVSYLFELIRAMETATGTLGVNSNINTTNYLDSSKNGIDCHLEKNTEYGTITLLAASEFGNTTSTDTESTGANGTGVFQMSNGKLEFVSNVFETSSTNDELILSDYNRALVSANTRYINKYVSGVNERLLGDGINETAGWYGAGATGTLGGGKNNSVILRGRGSIFGWWCHGSYGDYGSPAYANGASYGYFGARAVVVCGENL